MRLANLISGLLVSSILLSADPARALQFDISGDGHDKESTCRAAKQAAEKAAQARCKKQGGLKSISTSACRPRSMAYINYRESYRARLTVTAECRGTDAAQRNTPVAGNKASVAPIHYTATASNSHSAADACQAALKSAKDKAGDYCRQRGGIAEWQFGKCDARNVSQTKVRFYTAQLDAGVLCKFPGRK